MGWIEANVGVWVQCIYQVLDLWQAHAPSQSTSPKCIIRLICKQGKLEARSNEAAPMGKGCELAILSGSYMRVVERTKVLGLVAAAMYSVYVQVVSSRCSPNRGPNQECIGTKSWLSYFRLLLTNGWMSQGPITCMHACGLPIHKDCKEAPGVPSAIVPKVLDIAR